MSSGATTPAWDKGKPLTGLGGPGSCDLWSYSWVLWAGEGSGAWVVLGFTMPLLLGTAGFRLPLKLVLSVTLTGTAIYQVCPASVMPFASGPLLPTPNPEMTQAPLLSSPRAPPTILSCCFWPSWECWPTQKGGDATLCWAHAGSEHEFCSHVNTDLNPHSFIYLLSDVGRVTQHP